MKYTFIIVLLFTQLQIFSQEPPKVTLKDSSELKLNSLDISVEIVGDFATTTYDMKFYNELDRTLEGELAFPLGEGQSVSEFAMDVNGKLRKAVVVEKELARQAFENTVRQNIDPGLLEKTQGNNYKARVYPILPNSDKRIVLTYEQDLFSVNDFQTFELPLGINQILDEFSIKFKISGIKSTPIIKDSSYKDLNFIEDNANYEAIFTGTNLTPSSPILIQIPTSETTTNVLNYNDYFYANIPIKPNSKLKSKPKKITILWDASYSQRLRQLEKELKLLGSYISYLQDIDMEFVSFSNEIQIKKRFKIKKGNWHELQSLIEGIQYDGGTSFEILNSIEINSDEILLFSDGLHNLDNFSNSKICPLYTCCSVTSAAHEFLNNLATSSGGQHLNLQRLTNKEALDLLKKETFQFLGYKHNKTVKEVYPEKINVTSGFSITGRFSDDTALELYFGYGNKITEKIKIPVAKNQNSKLVKRLWARQKLRSLNKDLENNKEEIITHAKKHDLVTDFTSLVILDRIEDYVRYKIEPPHELKKEYKLLIKNIEDTEASKRDELKDRIDEINEDYNSIQSWYKTKYPKRETKVAKKKDLIVAQTPTQSSSAQNTQNDTLPSQNGTTSQSAYTPNYNLLDTTKRIVSGTVTTSDGEVMPGVTVVIKGTTTGTVTDIEGNFAINAEENDELNFSFIGFSNDSQIVGNLNILNVTLQEDKLALDEVVVVGYGVTRKSTLTSSVSIVSEELMGRMPGVHVNDNISSPSSIANDENSTMQKPMYIVDGMISSESPSEILEIEDIESMEMLKAENAVTLYGSQASSGLVIITTKKGKEANQGAIEELNKRISEKIELKSWNPDTPYIVSLRNTSTIELSYSKYLKIRNEFSNIPAFYLDVADFFDKKGDSKKAITILTNLIEIKLDDHELMRALAYKLEYFKQYKLAVNIYERILDLRPEEPQSYRDLALAYENTGDIQKSFNLLYKIYSGDLLEKDEDERFYGIEQIAYMELTRLVHKYPELLDLKKTETDKLLQMPVDIRVVIDWNHNDTDIDLWVTDPNGEQAYYKNTETKIGGHMSEDMMEGYGPEEFMIKNAISGNYKITVDYYSDNLQKISGPTILKATFFTNYGRKNEKKKILIFRLDKEEDEIEIGNLKFN